MCQVRLFVLSRLLSSLWVSRTGSASDWCALQEALYKFIDTIQYNIHRMHAYWPTGIQCTTYLLYHAMHLIVDLIVNRPTTICSIEAISVRCFTGLFSRSAQYLMLSVAQTVQSASVCRDE